MYFVYPHNTKELRARYKVYVHEIELEFGLLVFKEEGKPEQGREPTTNSTHCMNARSGNRTRVTLVGGERSHHCAIPAPQRFSHTVHIDYSHCK